MKSRTYLTLGGLVLAIALAGGGLLIRGQQPQKPQDSMSQPRMDEMNMRGDQAMGFDHLKTKHHFILESDGGSIKVEANNAKDKQSRDLIRMHLHHIAMMFSEGNFEVPMLVHAETPPGADVMKKLKSEITYRYEETNLGAMVRISTSNPDALQAVHDFLRYQIKEHMTGDPVEVKSKPN